MGGAHAELERGWEGAGEKVVSGKSSLRGRGKLKQPRIHEAAGRPGKSERAAESTAAHGEVTLLWMLFQGVSRMPGHLSCCTFINLLDVNKYLAQKLGLSFTVFLHRKLKGLWLFCEFQHIFKD